MAVESLTLPVASPAAQVLGATALQPERSRHVTAGAAITPAAGLDVTVDAYRIAINDCIVLSGNFTAPPIAALLRPFGANSARFFTNAIDTETNGVEAEASYHVAIGTANDLRLHGGYTHTRTQIVGSIATPPQLAGFESVLFDRIERRRIECGQPGDNARIGGEWRRRRLGVNAGAARYGSVCSFTLNPADDQKYSAKWLTDAEVSFRPAGFMLAIGGENLFDVFPDRNSPVNSFNGIQTFPAQSPFGMNGRTIYVRIGRIL